MEKRKSLKVGELYMIFSPRPIFDKPTSGRKELQVHIDWYTKPFVFLERKEFIPLEENYFHSDYSWYKILTTEGNIGWIFSRSSYFKKVKK